MRGIRDRVLMRGIRDRVLMSGIREWDKGVIMKGVREF